MSRTTQTQDESPKVCTRQIQKYQENHPVQQKKETNCKATDQFNQTPRQNTYRINKEDPLYNCIHTCPSLSIDLLSHVPSDLDTQYTPRARHVHHIPTSYSMYDKKIPVNNHGADGDRLLYTNVNFDPESSIDPCSCDKSKLHLTKDPKKPQKSDYLEDIDDSSLTRLALREYNDRMKAQYLENYSMDDSPNTLISGKNPPSLRDVVSSQIQIQQTLKMSMKKFSKPANKRSELLASISEEPIRSLSQVLESKSDNLKTTQQTSDTIERLEPLLSISKEISILSEQLKSKLDKLVRSTGQQTDDKIEDNFIMMSVNCEELVSTKLITPLVRKLQRLSLRVIQDELNIIEDLERLPYQINNIFRTAADQKNQKNK